MRSDSTRRRLVLRCPKTASQRCGRRLQCRHASRCKTLLPRATDARCALRWALLRGRGVHTHLLPPGVHGQDAQATELPLLPQCGGSRVGGLPSVLALPARARAWQRQHRCERAARGGRCRPDRRRAAQREPHRPAGGAPGGKRSPFAPGVPERVRGFARRVRADATAAAGEAVVDRHRSAGHSGSDGERLRQLAAIQCVASNALPAHAFGSASPRPRSASVGHARFPTGLSAAAGVGGDCCLFSTGARSKAVEHIEDGRYLRTVRVQQGGRQHSGWIMARPVARKPAIELHMSASLAAAVPAVLARAKRVFDLSCNPADISAHARATRSAAPGVEVAWRV